MALRGSLVKLFMYFTLRLGLRKNVWNEALGKMLYYMAEDYNHVWSFLKTVATIACMQYDNFLLPELRSELKPVPAWKYPCTQCELHEDIVYKWKNSRCLYRALASTPLNWNSDRALRASHPPSGPDLTNDLVVEQIPTAILQNLVKGRIVKVLIEQTETGMGCSKSIYVWDSTVSTNLWPYFKS